ncbi:hypothetical protein FXV77_08460 [Sphingobacterium phlebotomi]|uniref:Uncharacterized protein n=1 Tax=Sphingobacterium phlebotomi TaxID=2605433 RepID=A0A5D4H7E7_9SPHI|nr:hypothetical protein [Sphingobacterium phlebotomi]TYR36527.1 hypothetical protein FXV77_08460 [Sphingobacterium phlebotomi]
MKISVPKLFERGNQLLYQVDVEIAGNFQPLWYSLDKMYLDMVSKRSDAALVALLVPAMERGEDIYIKGKVSDKLFYSIMGPLQSVLCSMFPYLKKINVYVDVLVDEVYTTAKGVLTGFSGGVDSYCVLADHYVDSKVPESYKITHLLFNNVGSHGNGAGELFDKRYSRLRSIAGDLGLPFLKVDSNLDSFYSHVTWFQPTHTLRNTSVALLLQKGIGKYLYASTYSFLDVFIGPSKDMAYADVIILPMLSTSNLEARSVGSEYTRADKTTRVTAVPESYISLDVCINSDNHIGIINCSSCWKCLRTLATLEVAGKLHHYADIFDLDIYKKYRNAYFIKVLTSDDVLMKEIVLLAKENNFSFPKNSMILYKTKLYKLDNFVKRGFSKLKRIVKGRGRW